MNLSAPDAPQPDARAETAAMRFLRWLIEPPVEPQPGELRALRWLLRASAVALYCLCVGELAELGAFDTSAGGMGGGQVGRKNSKPAKPPA